VLADGMVIPRRAYAIPDIPEQRALLHYADGTETLVIETSFTGGGSNVAWVLPLPAPPKVESASTGLFPTLQVIFSPKIVLSVAPWWLALPIAAILFGLYRLVQRSGLILILLLLLLVLLLAPLFLPGLGVTRSAGISTSALASVRVLNRQRAGLFDTVTLRSTDPTALLHWLEENGFSAPTNIAPVLADYVRDGWVFTAAGLDGNAENASIQATHPLTFTFKTSQPVYPLRLTSKASTSCRVDLYVFGPGRASIPGFTVQRCERPTYEETQPQRWRLEPAGLHIRHHELAALLRGATVATKLSGNLTPSDMSHDAYVKWHPYWKTGGKRYGLGAALTFSANVAALALLAAAGWIVCFRFARGPQAATWGKWAIPGALALGALVYAAIPKAEAAALRVVKVRWSAIINDGYILKMALADEMPSINGTSGAGELFSTARLEKTCEIALRNSAAYWSHDTNDLHLLTNFFTGELVRFEASPGNFVFRCVRQFPATTNGPYVTPGAGRYELVWHDWDGAEALTNSFDVAQ
jgi:hypothetical protein